MTEYLFFDLDGTLCESKKELEDNMLNELARLSKKYQIILVSGAEYNRMLTQAPLKYATFMSQNGNEAYENDKFLWLNKLENREEIMDHIRKVSLFQLNDVPREDMVDDRGAQISFSFVGHHAPLEVKKKFDPDRKIRANILEKMPFKNALIGGTTCIDYIPFTKGENIARYMKLKNIKTTECLYIGDAFMNYGNDATVMGVIPIHQVKSPLETLNFIKLL